MNWLYRSFDKIDNSIKKCFVITFIVGLIVHLFVITNKLPNSDDLNQFYDSMNRLGYGRWFLFFPSAISGKLSITLAGIFGIFYIAVGAAFVVSTLKIKNSVCAVMIGLLMVSFPTVASTMNYMNCIDGFCFSLMLCCIATYLANRKSWIGWIFSAVLLILSLGIYQAYFPFAVAILVVTNLFNFLDDNKTKKELLLNGVKDIIILLCGLFGYLLVVKYTVWKGVELYDYKGISSMGSIDLAEIPSMVSNAYKNSLGFFINNDKFIHYDFLKYFFAVILTGSIICIFYKLIRSNYADKVFRTLITVVLILLLPIAAGFIYLMGTDATNMLTVYGYIIFLIFPLVVIDRYFCDINQIVTKNIWGIAVLAISTCVFVNYSVISNQAYLSAFCAYEQSYAYSNRLIARIESQSGFSNKDTIIFIGHPTIDTTETMWWRQSETQLKYMRGISYVLVNTTGVKTSLYLKTYLGVTYDITIWDEISDIENSEYCDEIKAASCYPDDGSIISGDGVVIVKFEELED